MIGASSIITLFWCGQKVNTNVQYVGRQIAHWGSELIIHIRNSSKSGGHLADLPANAGAAVPGPAGAQLANVSEVPDAKINGQMFLKAQPHHPPVQCSNIFCQGFRCFWMFRII